jgi:hypothetical protein
MEEGVAEFQQSLFTMIVDSWVRVLGFSFFSSQKHIRIPLSESQKEKI